MTVKSLSAFWANIYVGLKETRKYDPSVRDLPWPISHTLADVKAICQKYCDEKGFCVSVTETEFVYTNGNEPGAIVGIISYPRFPSNNGDLRDRALELGEILRKACGQYKVSIVMPSEVVMLGEEND